MERKKTKLKLSGNFKKSINNIERAKTQGKNSVVIEKKSNKFLGKKPFNFNKSDAGIKKNFTPKLKTSNFEKQSLPINNFEKRKLAEQRATRRLKADPEKKDIKGRIGTKKRELKLTVSRALSGNEEGRSRSLASLKRAKQKENRTQNDNFTENLSQLKEMLIFLGNYNKRTSKQNGRTINNIIKHLLGMGVTATINHSIDSDTAEYLVKEFGHNPIKDKKLRNNKKNKKFKN